MVEALAFEGVVAISASNGRMPWRRCDANPSIRLIVTDIRMPDMDGIALMEAAARGVFKQGAAVHRCQHEYAAKADIERARAAGVIDCLSKPVFNGCPSSRP